MITGVRRVVGTLVTLREGEGTTATLMFAYSFLAMTAYNVLRPVTRSQVIASLGADNLPYVQLAAGVLIGLLMQLYGRASGRFPRRVLIPATQMGEVALLLVFWLLFMTGAAWVSVAFYLLGLILGILLISQFWTLANDLYDARAAKRVFGFIGGGASLGGATGAAITAVAVDEVGTNNLLLVSAVLLTVCAGIVAAVMRRHAAVVGPGPTPEPTVKGGEAVRLLRSSRHLQLIALVISAAAIGAGIIDQQLNMAAESIQGSGATDTITGFIAKVTFYVSIVGFVIQVLLTSRIHRHLGLGVALLMLPIGLGATAAIILVTGAIWAPAAARVLDASLRYTVDKTSREVLFLPLPSSLKHLAKPFVDVTVDRLAKAFSALLVLVLIKPWGLGLNWRQLSYASLTVTAVWIVVALVARREYLRSFRRGLGTRTIEPTSVRLTVADASTIETLVEELASDDEHAVLYAIDLLESLEKRRLITPLLLHHESAKVRARALVALEAASAGSRARWAPFVERMLRDEDSSVRAAAVHALALFGMEAAAVTMRRYVDDPDPRVAATAASVLCASGTDSDLRLAEEVFTRLVSDTRPSAVRARREAATVLERVERPELRLMLIPLILDPEPAVAQQAIRSVRGADRYDPIVVPALVSLLGHRVLKRDARETLLSFGPKVVTLLAYILADEDEQRWIRRHIPGTLARLPVQTSMDALVGALDNPDGFIRYKALEGVERLHQADVGLTFHHPTVLKLIVKEALTYYARLTLRHNLVQTHPRGSQALLACALDDKIARGVDRVYRLLGLVYPWRDIAAARHTLQHADSRARASAAEYLDNLLGSSLRRSVMPMLEEAAPEERAGHAYAMLKTRPRDLDDTLAHLIHDEDPVVSSAAIQLAARQQVESLWGDIEFVLQRRSPADRDVTEAAAWALGPGRLAAQAGTPLAATLPVVEVADRLRLMPLFRFVSVDELFRIAASGRQATYGERQALHQTGMPVDYTRFLLAGTVRWSVAGESTQEMAAPAALGAEGALEGHLAEQTVEAVTPVVCLEIEAPVFLAMLGDSTPLAQGLFRMLLDDASGGVLDQLTTSPPDRASRAVRGPAFQQIDKVLMLRAHPLFSRATVEQLLDLSAIVEEVSAPADATVFDTNDPPAIWHVVRGQIRLERDGADAVLAEAGRTVGAAGVLTGVPEGWRATATESSQLLRVPGDPFFRLLADHTDLLQSLFSGVLAARRDRL